MKTIIPEKYSLGFVGAGLMGHGVCKNLLEKGFPLTVIAHRKREVVDDLVSRGAYEAESLEELMGRSNCVMVCLPTAEIIKAVLKRVIEMGSANQVVIDCSTNDPTVAEALATQAEAKGMHLLDACLMKGPKQAWLGELNVIGGGDADVFEAHQPLFKSFTKQIFYLGKCGNGHRVKLLNNGVSVVTSLVLTNIFALARGLGIDQKSLMGVISSGVGNSPLLQAIGPRLIEQDFKPEAPLNVVLKDCELLQGMAENISMPVPITSGAIELCKLGLAHRHDSDDFTQLEPVLVELSEKLRGLTTEK